MIRVLTAVLKPDADDPLDAWTPEELAEANLLDDAVRTSQAALQEMAEVHRDVLARYRTVAERHEHLIRAQIRLSTPAPEPAGYTVADALAGLAAFRQALRANGLA